ncbi:hypothetical protein BIZ42_16375 [Stenotrophomonas sp. LM091]|uniref:hypothetical protein n=1 Tax=Stenotrophomonas sp. LM091 TaxID=1904944 RepID=UPI00089DFD7B|nr:hypothetical protein [Stenotrophomonas sp. LM091]AOX63630.1 hypothetical protein BIZ42_16375 [Stenotrophomonas sp. LM091]
MAERVIKYPNDGEVKVKWSGFQMGMVVVPTAAIWSMFFLWPSAAEPHLLKTVLSISGLNVDIVGVVVASLKAPYFGAFSDGGELEFKREAADRKAFQTGMVLVGIGFFLQAISVLL